MKVTYIFHSGFMIETDRTVLIFDYYKGAIPSFPDDKEIYFFASHTHSDHFNPEIFRYADKNVTYILSKDIEDKINHRNMLELYKDAIVEYVSPSCEYSYGSINVTTYKSTDRGVAYLVNADGKNYYHAGDHYLWWLPKIANDKARRNDMLARFKRELEKMSDVDIDVAFIPLDGRLGQEYATGFHMYCQMLKINHIFPMHIWEEYDLIDKVKQDEKAILYKDKIESPIEEGQIFNY